MITSRRDTTLQRVAGYTGALMQTDPSYTVTGTGIHDFTFDGNRDQQNLASSFDGEFGFKHSSYVAVFSDFINSPHIAVVIGADSFGSQVLSSNFTRAHHFGV